MKEEILEPILRRMRIGKVLPVLKKFPKCDILDIGCGWNARFLQSAMPYIHRGTGIDSKAPDMQTEKIKTISCTLEGILPFQDHSFDVVTLLAVLEHLEQPRDIILEALRVLRPGGFIVGTVPSKLAKPVLEFLAYKLRIVNACEIRDHKEYYSRDMLISLLSTAGFINPQQHYFQFGMNNFFTAQKTPIA